MDVDLRRIPIRQETIEVCERLDVDPYKLEAKGSVLIGTAQGDALVRELEAHGIHAAVIGYADSGKRPSASQVEKLPDIWNVRDSI